MEAHFASYEEFSSSVVLLPFIDDSCVGAKVCSHNPLSPTQKNDNVDQVQQNSKETTEDQSGDNNAPQGIIESVEEIDVAADDDGNNRGETDKSKEKAEDEKVSPEINENGEEANVPDDDGTNREKQEASNTDDTDTTIQIPADYVLIKMKTSDNELEVEELELKEFTELLTLLREASYPLSLVFVPRNEIATLADSSREYGSDEEEVEDSQSSSQSSNDEADDESSKANPSVDEATKYAKQAASELRGRLSRWGSVAAVAASARASAAVEVASTKASQAASAVQELREGRSKEEDKKNQEWLPQVEPLSDEETLDSSSKNNCGGDNEDSESPNDQLTPNTSEEDNEGLEQRASLGSCDDANVSSDNAVDAETSSLDQLRVKQLETQLAEVHSRLEVKNTTLSKLQQKLDTSMNERKKIEREYRQSKKDMEAKSSKNVKAITEELQIITKALTKCEAELEEKKKKIDNFVAGNRDNALEHEKAIKALNNELSVCKAAVEARDAKVETLTDSMTELKTKLSAQTEELSAVESLRIDLTQTKTQSSTAVQVIEKMKKEESEFQNELKEAKGIVDELSKKYDKAKAAATKSTTEADKIKSDCRRLKMERNSLKTKAESLQKEMNQIAKLSKSNKIDSAAFEELQQLRLERTELQRDLEAERTEKRDLKTELNASRLSHQNPIISYQPTAGSDGTPRIDELERLIAELTEYSSAQALQIETLRQINAALTEDDITKSG